MKKNPSELDSITNAHQQVLDASAQLEEAVRRARQSGVTWQQIGDAMGVSKQAASQRFQQASLKLTDKSLDSITKEIEQITDSFFTALDREDISTLHSLMTYMTARQLSQRKILSIWHQTKEACGDFIEISNSRIEYNGTTFVYTYRLRHQWGEPVGQILFNMRQQITGWVIFLDDSAELPW